jgi:hypothetical protein
VLLSWLLASTYVPAVKNRWISKVHRGAVLAFAWLMYIGTCILDGMGGGWGVESTGTPPPNFP